MDTFSIFLPQIVTLFIFLIVISAVFLTYAKYEQNNKAFKMNEKNYRLIWISLGILLILTLGYYYLLKVNMDEEFQKTRRIILMTVLPLKIIMAFVVSNEAKKQNRNKIIWGVMGFLEFHSALIILGLSKTIHPLTGKSLEQYQNIKNEMTNKIKSLKELAKVDARTKNIFEYQKNKLYNQFDKDLNTLIIQNKKDEKIHKLGQAFSAGVISQNEFEERVKFIQESQTYF